MKYMFINDIKFIINTKKKFLFFLFVIPIIFIIIFINNFNYYYEFIPFYYGSNDNLLDSNIMKIIPFILNYFVLLYLTLNIYSKDLKNKDYLFLRISQLKWVLNKILIIFIMIFFTKSIQLLIFLMLMKFNVNAINMLLLFYLYDILFNFLIQLLVICIYNFTLLKNNLSYLFYIFSITLLFIPKKINQINILDISSCMIISFLTVCIIIFSAKTCIKRSFN